MSSHSNFIGELFQVRLQIEDPTLRVDSHWTIFLFSADKIK